MNPLKSNLNSCEVGDYVYTCFDGWVKIDNVYETRISICSNTNTYTKDGKRKYSDLYPSAWTSNPFDPDNEPPCKFKDGDEVLVSRDCYQEWKRIFAYKKDNRYYCYTDGQNKWTSGGAVTEWENCISRDME